MPSFPRLAAGGFAAGALLLLAAGVAMAAEPQPLDVNDGPIETLTGTLVVGYDADGSLEYLLVRTDLPNLALSVGPPWHWTVNPLAQYVGFGEVTVTGRTETDPGPEFEVYTITGDTAIAEDLTTTVRTGGRPPWAGGPKFGGENHPGLQGWSQGQGNGAAASPQP